jgi:cell division protein FtsI (penicillin-binding protein 3)
VINNQKSTFLAWRFHFIIVCILIFVIALISRLVDLTIFQQHFLRKQGDARALRIVSEPAMRGMITDRDGYPLAISTLVYSVWINPKEFSANNSQIKKLITLLNLKNKDFQKLTNKTKKQFVYLKRGIEPAIAKNIQNLQIPGVYFQREFKRFYPEGIVDAHVIGFTNVDDRGQEGLELAENNLLQGVSGKKIILKDRMGREFSELRRLQDGQPGKNLALSLNRRIQYLAYRELLAGMQEYDAVSGSAIVLNAKTGEILAMVNQPSFNPNNRLGKKSDDFRNRAVTDTFEPGSTIKAFSVASALDSGLYTPESIIDTNPGWFRVGHNIVRDEHTKGKMTVTQILQISSNVGISKIILSIPPNQLWSLLDRVGFGQSTGIGFPGEQAGRLIHQKNWKPFALATLSFGYGIAITPLQLAQAYSVFANDGIKIPLSLKRIDQPPEGKRVINEKVAKQMLQVLESVMEKGGTGAPAKIPGYRVAGKTGTARLLGPNGYMKNHHASSFVGILPASDPQLVIAVVMIDPRGKKYYGGDVAGPVFKNIAVGALRVLNIPPDDMSALKTTL